VRIPSYPKVHNLGHPLITDLFSEPVVVQEKIDGSQFSFAVIDGKLLCRSKGAMRDIDNPDKLFAPAVDTAKRLRDDGLIKPDLIYRGEALFRPKHNTITYERAPEGGFILFDLQTIGGKLLHPSVVAEEAVAIGLESVPTYAHSFDGKPTMETLDEWLDRDSCLGGVKVEGVVMKSLTLFGRDDKPLMGKFVSERFKEAHTKDWRRRNLTRGDVIETIIEGCATEARWEKAVQHLRDDGLLQHAPQDIGPLIRAARADTKEEMEEDIKDALFKHFWPKIEKGSTCGLPEWYKRRLAAAQDYPGREDLT